MSLHCDLCGLDFDPECVETGCTGCPLQRSCQHVTCPRCGSAVLPEAALIGWLRRLGERWQRTDSKSNQKGMPHEY